jgi:signal transduction histidine kinase
MGQREVLALTHIRRILRALQGPPLADDDLVDRLAANAAASRFRKIHTRMWAGPAR